MLQRGVVYTSASHARLINRPVICTNFIRFAHSANEARGSKDESLGVALPDLGKHGRRLAWSKDQRTLRGESKSSHSPKYRSNNSKNVPLDGRTPLQRMKPDPYNTSAHVRRLLSNGKFEEAVKVVKESPNSRLSSPVWNKLLHNAMENGKHQVAYSLYIEMKRRGYSPTLAAYTCLLQGWNNISSTDWPRYTKQVEHCDAVYQSYREYVSEMKKQGHMKEVSLIPIAYYLKILNKLGQHQKMFDVLYSLDEDGPLAPNCSVYGALFWSFLARRTTEKLVNLNIDEQNAADAKLLWRQMEKNMSKRGFPLTWYAAVPILRLLARGRPSDHQLAIEIIRKYYGLAPPGETPPAPQAELSWEIFQSILDMCNKLRKFRLCIYYVNQVMDKKPAVLDRYHVNQVLLAYHGLSAVSPGDESIKAYELIQWMRTKSALGKGRSATLRPIRSTYQLALAICWRCEDWDTAGDVCRLMTGYEPEDFMDGRVRNEQIVERIKSERDTLMSLDPTSAAFLARTALASKEKPAMKLCIQMLVAYDWRELYAEKRDDMSYHPFYQNALAASVVKMINIVAKENPSPDTKALWQELKDESKMVMKRPLPQRIPELEQTWSLSGASSNPTLQKFIDFDMAVRTR